MTRVGLLGWRRWIDSLDGHVCTEGDDHDACRRKVLCTVAVSALAPAGVAWAALYFAFGERWAAVIPLASAPVTVLNVAVFLRTRRFDAFRNFQQALILLLPFALQLALGGFVAGSAVIVWSFISIVLALLFGPPKTAVWWFVAYVVLVVAAAALQPGLRPTNQLPLALVTVLFVLNLGTVSLIVFAVFVSFVTDRRKLRALELAYLNQELALRQAEKMATLGTLVAGVAHELNNPAAATRRASQQLCETIDRLGLVRAGTAADIDALERSDRESAIEAWLREHGVADNWELATSLVDQGVDVPALTQLAGTLDGEALSATLGRTASAVRVHQLVDEISDGSGRISEIVDTLKSYSFLGQAPVQPVNLNAGLDATLAVLRSKLKDVDVQRDYAADLPLVPAYGSELNQVWTNLLNNAIDATRGAGTIRIRSRCDGEAAVVEIEDDGPGIPEAMQARIFDPFFTTKEPGRGTGLGLSTSYSIVTEKHHGKISVESRPGSTRFIVSLPLSG